MKESQDDPYLQPTAPQMDRGGAGVLLEGPRSGGGAGGRGHRVEHALALG